MWGTIKRISKVLFSLSIILIICFLGFLIYLKGHPLPEQNITYTTKFFSKEHQLINTMSAGQNRTHLPLDSINKYIVYGTIAIEDHRFYSHFGFDLKGIARAVYINLQNQARSQGASTISQQLARNLYLTHEKTWERKIYEAIYTIQLELHYSKDYILEKYLNQVYYGHGCYGVESAAQKFYGKSAADLTLAESAMLVGVPKGPTYYSPFNDYENASNRQKLVLTKMLENGYISEEEYQAAQQEELVFAQDAPDSTSSVYYFRDYVLSELETLGFEESQVRSGGLEIITTLDMSMQETAASLIDSHLEEYPDIQGALVTMHPETGDILAMVGGRDYTKSSYNRVTAKRQPGSTFKPFVYLTALDNGLTPMAKLKSEPARFTYDQGRQVYTPKNFNDFYYNEDISFLKALSVSDNIVAVKANLMVRPENVKNTAELLGIDSYLQVEPSLALGAFPVSPLEMTTAYATIANQGVRVKPRSVLEVRDHRGRILYTSESVRQQVHAPETLYILTDMMRSVFETGGTGARVAHLLPFDIAGKTGTTDTDAWMVGFTPDNVTSVWVGYDRDRFINRQESYLATPIWASYISATAGTTMPVIGQTGTTTIQHHKQFTIPKNVIPVEICLDTGLLPEADCKNTRVVYFLPGTEPRS